MELKPELLAVLTALGANDSEVASLKEYYTSQLAAADTSVATLQTNIASLQKQLGEESARAERIKAGVAKFVSTTDPQESPSKAP